MNRSPLYKEYRRLARRLTKRQIMWLAGGTLGLTLIGAAIGDGFVAPSPQPAQAASATSNPNDARQDVVASLQDTPAAAVGSKPRPSNPQAVSPSSTATAEPTPRQHGKPQKPRG